MQVNSRPAVSLIFVAPGSGIARGSIVRPSAAAEVTVCQRAVPISVPKQAAFRYASRMASGEIVSAFDLQPRRDLTLLHATSRVVGITIGTGIFLKSAVMAQAVGTPVLVLAAWVVAGLVAMLGALSFAELGALLPDAGGEYVYLRAAFGEVPGFLYACNSFVLGGASIAAYGAAVAIFVSDIHTFDKQWFVHTVHLFGSDYGLQFGTRQLIAIAVIGVFAAINCAGVMLGGRVQTVLAVAKVAAIIAVAGGVFAFYLAVNTAYLYALPLWQVASANSTAYPEAPSVAARAVQTFLGTRAAPVAALIFLISTVGSLNGTILARARVSYASARDGLFFAGFGRLSPRTRVPVTSLVLLCLWAALLAVSGTFDQLTNMAVMSYALFWIPVMLAVLVLRRRLPHATRPYRLPGYPFVPLVFALVMVWIVISALITTPRESIATLLLILLGLPLYPLFRKRRATRAAAVTPTPAPRA